MVRMTVAIFECGDVESRPAAFCHSSQFLEELFSIRLALNLPSLFCVDQQWQTAAVFV
jgi:hypothetical protein